METTTTTTTTTTEDSQTAGNLSGMIDRLTADRWNGYSQTDRLARCTSEALETIASLSLYRRLSLFMSDERRTMFGGMLDSDSPDWDGIATFSALYIDMRHARLTLQGLERTVQSAKSAIWDATNENSGCDAGKREFLESTGLFDDEEIDSMFERRYVVTFTYYVDAHSEEEAIERANDGDGYRYSIEAEVAD